MNARVADVLADAVDQALDNGKFVHGRIDEMATQERDELVHALRRQSSVAH